MKHFFHPNSGEDQKKKSSARIDHFFPHIYAQMYNHSNYWVDADVDHSQTIGGDTAKLLGGYIPHPPLVLAPLDKGSVFTTILIA